VFSLLTLSLSLLPYGHVLGLAFILFPSVRLVVRLSRKFPRIRHVDSPQIKTGIQRRNVREGVWGEGKEEDWSPTFSLVELERREPPRRTDKMRLGGKTSRPKNFESGCQGKCAPHVRRMVSSSFLWRDATSSVLLLRRTTLTFFFSSWRK